MWGGQTLTSADKLAILEQSYAQRPGGPAPRPSPTANQEEEEDAPRAAVAAKGPQGSTSEVAPPCMLPPAPVGYTEANCAKDRSVGVPTPPSLLRTVFAVVSKKKMFQVVFMDKATKSKIIPCVARRVWHPPTLFGSARTMRECASCRRRILDAANQDAKKMSFKERRAPQQVHVKRSRRARTCSTKKWKENEIEDGKRFFICRL